MINELLREYLSFNGYGQTLTVLLQGRSSRNATGYVTLLSSHRRTIDSCFCQCYGQFTISIVRLLGNPNESRLEHVCNVKSQVSGTQYSP
jgi:hypothetical protein